MSEEVDVDLDLLSLEDLLKLHLKVNNCSWTIHDSHIHGQGLFATDDIEEGDVIFKDIALVLGPRSGPLNDPVCAGCLSNKGPLISCSKNCHLPVCSVKCEDSQRHMFECKFLNDNCQFDSSDGFSNELIRCSTPIRCLEMTNVQRKILIHLEKVETTKNEVDLLKNYLKKPLSKDVENFLRLCCGILDTNAYGGAGYENCRMFRGLFALSAIMNHSCSPNTTYWFDDLNRMVVKASRKIQKDEEILSTYTSLLWSTATRRSFLSNTKHFLCKCKRCKDPTEFGTNLSGIYCKIKTCKGILLPENSLNFNSIWICNIGDKTHSIKAQQAFQTLNISSNVANMLIQNGEMSQINKFCQSLPENNQAVVQIKKHFVLLANQNIKDLPDDKLLFKEKSCLALLKLITDLKLGQNYLKGMVLQELHLVRKEISKRLNTNNSGIETLSNEEFIINEFEKILKF